MDHEPPDDIDRRIREGFESEPRAPARIARGALDTPPPRHRRRWETAGIAAVAGVLAAVALSQRPPEPAPALRTAASIELSSLLADGFLVVTLPDGSVSISGGDPRDERPADGQGLVIAEGDRK